MSFWREGIGEVTVMVKVHPRARKPGVGGRVPSAAGERLKIAVKEAPEDGRANAAVCQSLAHALDVPVSAVRLMTGASHREKLLAVAGDVTSLIQKLGVL